MNNQTSPTVTAVSELKPCREVHGYTDSPTYASWCAMKTRCNNSNRHSAHRYKGTGITYDKRWESFVCFLEDMGERPDGKTLDRKDAHGHYCKENCRWADPIVQSRNRRNAKLTFDQAVAVAKAMLSGASAAKVAAEFGCSESLPREIVNGRTWKDALLEAKRHD